MINLIFSPICCTKIKLYLSHSALVYSANLKNVTTLLRPNNLLVSKRHYYALSPRGNLDLLKTFRS